MKISKILKYTSLSFVVLLLLFSFLVFMTIKNSKGCKQIVIDTYEIHSNIDIPSVSFVNCYYDESLGIRISVYDLHAPLNMFDFERMEQSPSTDILKGRFLLADNELPKEPVLYKATGEKWGRIWTYVLDTKSDRLWVELVY